jgi:hypothetical protein
MPAIGRIGFWAAGRVYGDSRTISYKSQVVGVVKFPLDEILIFGTSLCIIVPFVLEILALHYSSPIEKRFWTHAALTFTTMYAVFGAANYVVQLATVIPAKLRGAGDTIGFLEQTPHSLF